MRFELSENEKEFLKQRRSDPDIMKSLPVKDAGKDMSLGIRIVDPVKASYILVNLMNKMVENEMSARDDLGFEITHICLTPIADYAKIEPFKEELLALVDKHFYGEEN